MKGSSVTLLAPAKLNLFLHITGRRADGYHELQTLFQLLNFGDSLCFTPAPPGELSLHLDKRSRYKSVPLENNLIMTACRRLQTLSQRPVGIRIELTKRLPSGAGLGGGSSDAAITLLALNRLWGLNLGNDRLQEIGLELGADVPVFVAGRSAWAESLGEQLQPVSLKPAWYLVLTPVVEVSTARIFGQENLTRNSTAIKMSDFLAGRTRNDCESVTCALYPEIARALAWLSRQAPARMTGTGAALFARFDTEAEAREVFERRPADLEGFIAQGVDSLELDFSGL